MESTGEVHRLSEVAVHVWRAMLARPGSFYCNATWLDKSLPDGGDGLDDADLEAFDLVLQELARTGLAVRRGA